MSVFPKGNGLLVSCSEGPEEVRRLRRTKEYNLMKDFRKLSLYGILVLVLVLAALGLTARGLL
jgi:hypothetical protein